MFFDENIHNIGIYELNEEESKHISRVLRLKRGEKINITNGHGKLFQAEIVETGKRKCTVNVLTVEEKKKLHNYSLHIAIAPTKNISRFEWFVEKAVEIGVDRITPLLCRYSERKQLKIDRLNRIVISAMKQSLKFHKPQVDEMTSFDDFISAMATENRFIALCEAENKQLSDLKGKDILIVIGPEGGFSSDEIFLAKEKKFKPVKISNYRLRTETAGVVACNLVNFFLEK